MRKMNRVSGLFVFVLVSAFLLLFASGCTSAKRGEATTATAGHSPIIQMQAGVHFYSSNTRPIQAPDVAAERENMPKFADSITLGNLTVTTTTTISSGAGDVQTSAADDGDQTPSTPISTAVEVTP